MDSSLQHNYTVGLQRTQRRKNYTAHFTMMHRNATVFVCKNVQVNQKSFNKKNFKSVGMTLAKVKNKYSCKSKGMK